MVFESSINHQYSTPEGLRIYAIGDVHGHLDALAAMHETISADLLRDPPGAVHLVYMGDYVDRGPDNRAVIDYLMARQQRGDGIEKSFLLGNHEANMMRFLRADDPRRELHWLKWGGLETLASYDAALDQAEAFDVAVVEAQARFRAHMPQDHLDFMDDLSLMVQLGDYVFAHAGIDPRRALTEQKKGALLSVREPFLSWDQGLGFCVVHGHTITADKKPEVRAHRIGIDTGLFEGGPLTAAVLEGRDVRFLQVRV